MDSTPPGQQQNAEEAALDRLQSKESYKQKYREYSTWKRNNGVRETTEDVFITYLAERSKVVYPGTLWNEHSMLKTMLNLRENIDLKQMIKVRRFMEQNGKRYMAAPTKSKQKYEHTYSKYCTWRNNNGVSGTTEDMLVMYLTERSNVVGAGTLRSELSMLKTMIRFREKIDVNGMNKVIHFINGKPNMEALLQGQQQHAKKATLNKTNERNEQKYSEYCIWKSNNGVMQTTEDVLIMYLTERSKIVNSGNLWTELSILKDMIKRREKIELKQMYKVKCFLRQKYGEAALDKLKSKEKYEQKYNEYCNWKSENGIRQTTEDGFIKYLAERRKVVTQGILCREHGMLKAMIKLRERINVAGMYKVQCFIKQKYKKTCKPKMSRTLTDLECMQFLKAAPDHIYLMMKVALIIGIHGVCRNSEMTEFEVEHLTFHDDYLVLNIPKTKNSLPRIFTVPNSRDGLHMAYLVKKYIALRPAHTPHKRLFIYYGKGKCSINPVHINTFSMIPAKIAIFLNLPRACLYKGECFQRTWEAADVLTNAGGCKSSTVTNEVKVEQTDEEMECETQLPLRTIEPKEGEDFYNAENGERISSKVEQTDEEMNYEEHLPGSSTPSPSRQDIVLSPLTIGIKEEEDFKYAENDERISSNVVRTDEEINDEALLLAKIERKEGENYYNAEKYETISLIFKKKLSFLRQQVPLKITDDEYKVMYEMVCDDDVFMDATLQTKVHCTVCDIHLGTAPVAQLNRFVHPVLNTLMCEFCFGAYDKGDFSKDEDGSEMYCRWCGQAGTVMCCSDCPLVFCQACVERNFGERVCEEIINADPWHCFKCNPSQLSRLQIMCAALHEYTLKTIKYAIRNGDKAILEKDISICCKEDSTTTHEQQLNARTRTSSRTHLDDELDLQTLRKRLKVCHDWNKSLSTPDEQSAPPTLERPATPEKQPVIPTFQPQDSKSPATSTAQNVSFFSDASTINPPVQRILLPKISPPAVPQSPPLVADISLPLPSECTEISQDRAALKPGMLVLTRVEGKKVLPTLPSTQESNTKQKVNAPKCILLKNTLFRSQKAISKFSHQCEDMRDAIETPNSDAQYAYLQNSMQDALYKCINSLLQARNVLTSSNALFQCESLSLETFNGLTSSNANTKQVPKKVPARVPPAAKKTAVTSVDGAIGKNSTVILRNKETNVLTALPIAQKVVNQTRPVLLKPPGSQPPILLIPTQTPAAVRTTQSAINTNSAITTTGLKPVLLNQVNPMKTVRLVKSNGQNYSIVFSKVGSKTFGNNVPSSMVSASKNNMYDKHVMVGNKTKTVDKDPLAMSKDENEGS